MNSSISIDPGSAKAELLDVIKNFSRYLSCQKQSGIIFPKISETSKAIIQSWGKDLSASASFLCQGPENARIFIIDSQAIFFKGETGQLLSRILTSMGLSAMDVLICNCDMPGAVKNKIRKLMPKIIITLGEEAGRVLLGPGFCLKELRGKFNEFNGIKVMPTFHPSLLLEHPQYKRQVWEDMKLVMKYAGLKNDA